MGDTESLHGPMREERRIVTALFADIVGSTTITERLDPEDARAILGTAISLEIEQVDALGGTIKDLAGDGVLALFGAPVAHEDDAERAVLCGLRIVQAIEDHAVDVAERWGVEVFSVRVGIETGRAVMGPVGGGSHVEYGATGDVVNTAARLQSHAEPGTVLVGEVTRTMAEDRFDWGPARSLELKGKEQRIDASPALAYAPRRHTTAGIANAPLVSRTTELKVLDSAIADATDGTGSIVIVVGDAGVGKSRLIQETRDRFTRAGGQTWLEAAATSYGVSTPYLPYRNLFLTLLGLPLSARREEAEAAVEAGVPTLPPATLEGLRTMLPTLTGAPEEASDPEALQGRVFGAVQASITALAEEHVLALALEDLHWCDPTSISLTERLIAAAANEPLLMLVTTRPERSALEATDRLAGLVSGHVVRIDLPPLSRDGDRRLLRALIGEAELPRPLEERILDTTDGNPFFVEEQVRALVASGTLARSDGSWCFVRTKEPELAPTVERALVARIDRLPDSRREVLLAASVLGSRFDVPLVSALIGTDPRDALDDLEQMEFVDSLGRIGDDAHGYRFRHALTQEAAYASLLRRQRRILHGRAAAALEAEYAGREDAIAGTLGRHLAEAGDAERAVGYLLMAARNAAATFANEEAASLARDARSLLRGLNGEIDPSQRNVAIELSTIEGTALRFLARYDESIEAFRSATDLLGPAEVIRRATAGATIGEVLVDAHRYEDALRELDAAESLVAKRLDDDEAFQAWLDIQLSRGSVFYWRGDVRMYSDLLRRVEPHVKARATRRQRIDYYSSVRSELWRRDRYVISDELLRLDQEVYEAERESEDEEVRAWAAFMHGFTLMWHRDIDEAEPLFREALAAAERLGSALLRSRVLTYLMVTARLRGDVDQASSLVEPVREAAEEAALPEYEAMASATVAWAAYRRDDPETALREGARAIEVWAALPNRYPIDWMAAFPLLAVALGRHDVEGARQWAEMLLAGEQQPLPDAISGALRSGIEAARSGDARLAEQRLVAAVADAADLGYL